MRKSRQSLEEISTLLDETISKGAELESKNKKKQARYDLRKSLSHDPFSPVAMIGENADKYYNPYRQIGDGSFVPHPVEHWRGLNQNEFLKDPTIYRTTRDFYAAAGVTSRARSDEPVVLLRRSLHDEVSNLFKGRGLPAGTVREWQGYRYQKQGDGQWVLMSDGGSGQHPIEKDHGDRLAQIKKEIDQRKQGKPEPKSTDKRVEDVTAKEKELGEREEQLKQNEMKHQSDQLSAREKELDKREKEMSGGDKKPQDDEGKKQKADESKTDSDKKGESEKIDTKALQEKVARKPKGQGGAVDLSKAELDHLLETGKYALVSSGRNPAHDEDSKLSDSDIESRHGQLESELKDDGFMYSKVTGHYGGKEDSFLVMIHDADREHLSKLGERYNQDSVIYSEGGKHEMIYTTGENKGKHHPGEGHEEKPDAEDFFTVLKHPDGSETKFALNFDFDKIAEAQKGKDGKTTTKSIENSKSTADMHMDDKGNYTPERQKLHKQIVDKILSQVKPSKNPAVVITGGGSGSGKSSVLREVMPKMSEKFAHIDSDMVKENMPEYNQMVKAGDENAAVFSHEESSHVASLAMKQAAEQNKSVVYDTTMKSADKIKKLMGDFRDKGYTIHVLYADLPVEKAVERAEARAKETGRKVPQDVIHKSHEGAMKTLGAVADDAHSVTVYNNDGDPPPKVAYARAGRQDSFKHPEYYEEMTKRGHMVKSEKSDKIETDDEKLKDDDGKNSDVDELKKLIEEFSGNFDSHDDNMDDGVSLDDYPGSKKGDSDEKSDSN